MLTRTLIINYVGEDLIAQVISKWTGNPYRMSRIFRGVLIVLK